METTRAKALGGTGKKETDQVQYSSQQDNVLYSPHVRLLGLLTVEHKYLNLDVEDNTKKKIC